jgi:hypothetical protein
MKPVVLDDLEAAVARNTQVVGSAVTLINGIATRIQAAIDAAIAGGATAEQLAGVQAEVDAIKKDDDDLAAAVAANTPAQP